MELGAELESRLDQGTAARESDRSMTAGTDSTAEGSTISLPKAGGAVSGLGENFGAPALAVGEVNVE
jgi:hypothetical protein